MDLAGILHDEGMPHRTIEQMNDDIAAAAAESVMESFTRDRD
ncbi:hypothetical protein [Protaetiibacter larvae]|nr:hypothetical protein [Protaetiibacter larvae]